MFPTRRKALAAVGLLTIAIGLGVLPGDAQTPKPGGMLKIGMIGEPPTLDSHATTAVITREIGINMFETLFALDAKFQPVPHLIDGHDVADGGKRYTLRLRKGVKFHNGKELTAADVVASLARWGKMSSPGKAVFKNVEAVEAKNPATVEIRLKEPAASLPTNLAQVDNAAVIYPKEVIEASGDGSSRNTSAPDRTGSSSTSLTVTSSSRASTDMPHAPRRRPGSRGGASRTSTSSTSCRCPTTRPGRPASSPANTITSSR